MVVVILECISVCDGLYPHVFPSIAPVFDIFHGTTIYTLHKKSRMLHILNFFVVCAICARIACINYTEK